MAASLPSLSVTETMGYRASVVEPGSHTLLDSGGCLDAANHQRSATSTAREVTDTSESAYGTRLYDHRARQRLSSTRTGLPKWRVDGVLP